MALDVAKLWMYSLKTDFSHKTPWDHMGNILLLSCAITHRFHFFIETDTSKIWNIKYIWAFLYCLFHIHDRRWHKNPCFCSLDWNLVFKAYQSQPIYFWKACDTHFKMISNVSCRGWWCWKCKHLMLSVLGLLWYCCYILMFNKKNLEKYSTDFLISHPKLTPQTQNITPTSLVISLLDNLSS